MKYTEKEFGKTFGVTLATPEKQELFLKANAKCAYDLYLINGYIKNIGNDSACIRLNRLRKAKLCS